ncbi:MAG: 4-vinyl reductase [Deltaproteobacteria bacterium]|nr:4-vinyl reductase [Deltaproteobacteria bacterium]
MPPSPLADRLTLHFDAELHRRLIGRTEVIIHCHHYNARLQRVVEEAAAIDGKALLVRCAEAAFAQFLARVIDAGDPIDTRWQMAGDLYAHLGFGRLDFAEVAGGVVRAPSSHFVEGWRACHSVQRSSVCSMTEGYLQAAVAVATGRPAHVREAECMFTGAPACRFEIDTTRTGGLESYERHPVPAAHGASGTSRISSPTVDEAKIVRALVEMPIRGNAHGLIPAFNVYLANTPADFYNLLAIRFVEEMERVQMGDIARRLLFDCAEACAMNTFRGILASAEWEALIAPMVREPADSLFGLIAVSNALGWGDWHVVEHVAEQRLTLASRNGYEATGFAEMRGAGSSPVCVMLAGVSAGIMELLYGRGTVQDRLGQYGGVETACRCRGEPECVFLSEAR